MAIGSIQRNIFFFRIRTLHRAIIKVIYSPTNAKVIVLKTILKFTLKQLPTCFGVTVTPSSGSALICAY